MASLYTFDDEPLFQLDDLTPALVPDTEFSTDADDMLYDAPASPALLGALGRPLQALPMSLDMAVHRDSPKDNYQLWLKQL